MFALPSPHSLRLRLTPPGWLELVELVLDFHEFCLGGSQRAREDGHLLRLRDGARFDGRQQDIAPVNSARGDAAGPELAVTIVRVLDRELEQRQRLRGFDLRHQVGRGNRSQEGPVDLVGVRAAAVLRDHGTERLARAAALLRLDHALEERRRQLEHELQSFRVEGS
eukprot:4701289-Prymnesium_polylepis.1